VNDTASDIQALPRAPRGRIPTGWLGATVHVAAIALCVWSWRVGWWPLGVALWAVIVWMNHFALTLLHEGAHGMLSTVRWVNEVLGILIGTVALIPLSVYRYVHARHHAHLGRERDPEFWPYNLPCSGRAVRVTYAWLELLIGWVFTPLLYSVRTARSWPHVHGRQRERIVLEWAIIAIAWTALVLVVIRFGWGAEFVLGFLVPAWGAGVFQTIRKFTEHLGMHGDSILAMTRTVVYRRRFGRAASRSQLHVDHHGTHHRFARIPYDELPRATAIVYGGPESEHVFPSHLAAIRDMLPSLLDPKVGPQWRTDAPKE
jgi:fatty acid desaturase